MDIREKVLGAIEETQKNLYEREELARLIWATIGANLNILMLGDPGTAKTMIAVNLTQTISQAKKFQYTLNSFTTIDELFGHFDLLELKNNNKLKRNIDNKLLDCHIAYLDEFFKSNSGTLNALLDVMNEKIYIDSYGTTKLPLKFLISSSNELPAEEDGLSAVLDRFQVKYLVKAIQDHSTRIGAYLTVTESFEDVEETMNLADLDEFREAVNNVKYTKEVAEMTERIYQALLKENVTVSDRTIFKSISLVKAAAFLRDSDTVAPGDLLILKDVFWTELSDMKTVKKVIFELANPLYGKIEEIWDAIQTTIEEKDKEIKQKESEESTEVTQIAFELVRKIKNAKTEINKVVEKMKKTDIDPADAESKMGILGGKIDELFGDTPGL